MGFRGWRTWWISFLMLEGGVLREGPVSDAHVISRGCLRLYVYFDWCLERPKGHIISYIWKRYVSISVL